MESTAIVKEDQGCCPAGSHGAPASAYTEAKGTVMKATLNGIEVDCYEVGPVDAKVAIIAVHDIFGIHASRVKALADFLADHGCRVILPDWHKNESVVPGDQADPA